MNKDPEDAAVHAYIKQRNKIAKAHGLTLLSGNAEFELDSDRWSTVDKIVTSDLRTDSGGLIILQRFERQAKKYAGGCYADDGESIALWSKPANQVREIFKQKAEAVRASIGNRALFHPGYLPVAKRPGWKVLRVQNPNMSPYTLDVEWLWCMAIKPGLDLSALTRRYEFEVDRITATIRWPDRNYDLPNPYVNTQKQLDRIIADINCFAAKLKQVEANYANLKSNASQEKRRKIWPK